MRQSLETETVIELIDAPRICDAQRCFQYEIIRELSKGASSICYVANRLDSEGHIIKKVLLKEYYPERAPEGVFVRTGEGTLTIRKEEIEERRRPILSVITRIQEYVNNAKYKEIRRFLCIDDDIEPLYAKTEDGNGSVYYENLYIDGIYWIDVGHDVVLSQVLQTASSVSEFLQLFHNVSPQTAYIDIKPEDILIRNDVNSTPNYSDILLFDFDNCRLFGTYPRAEVEKWITYKPDFFNSEEQIRIDVESENCTLGKVLSKVAEDKEKDQKVNLYGEQTTADSAIAPLIDCDQRSSWMATIEESKVKKRMDDIKDALELDEKRNLERRRIPLFHWWGRICWLLLLLTTSVFLFQIEKTINDGGISHTRNVLWLLLHFSLLVAFTFLTYHFAQKKAHIDVGVKYFEKRDSKGGRIRNTEYNTFRLSMTRKGRTFLDESDLHRRQQKERHRWWFFLAFGIVGGCVVVSIICKALPMWYALGLVLLILFMFVDYLSNRNVDYERYLEFCRCGNRNKIYDTYFAKIDNESTGQSTEFQKAVFYGEEYEKGGFDLESRFYCNSIYASRNLTKIRTRILELGYSGLDLKHMPRIRDYNRRTEHIKEKEVKSVDLGYGVLQMKQIYKMTFDRLKNVELIVLLSVATLLLSSVVLAALHGSEAGIAFSRVPTKAYYAIVMLVAVFAGIYNVIRACLAESYEYYVTEMAYKSRFVGSIRADGENSYSFALNEQLQRDIVAGYIQPIDIARGTTRYQGSVIGTINGEPISVRNAKINEFSSRVYNRPLLHHREIANARRLAITMWCSFGVGAFLLVWMLGFYWAFFPLLSLTIATHIYFRFIFLPRHGRKKIIQIIEKYRNREPSKGIIDRK